MQRLPVLAFALIEVTATWQGEPQTPTIRMDVNLVQLSLRVTDRDGHSVAGLKKDAFELFVDDVRWPISLFQNEDAPVTAGIVVDNSASMRPKRDEVIAAATAFAQASNPRDEMFVVHFNQQARFGLPRGRAFTASIPELHEAISRFELGGTTALYDGIMLARTQFRIASYVRKVLLVITDGGDNSSKSNFADVLKGAVSDGAVIFAIGIYDEGDQDYNPKLLTQLAQATGGEAYFPKDISEVTRICQQVAAEVRRQYTIGFRGATDGKYHRVRVTASDPARGPLTVHAREGYFAAQPIEPENGQK